jgi:hypothetical protein
MIFHRKCQMSNSCEYTLPQPQTKNVTRVQLISQFVVSSGDLDGTTRHSQRSVVDTLVGHPVQYNDMV